jgi:acetate CoA/acetoacetate CoA-transferase beta subunit
MTKTLRHNEQHENIAQRVAKELKGPLVVNLGIGIPTLIPKFLEEDQIYFHTENGLLGVREVNENEVDPNIVNAGKKSIGEDIGASYFNSADSFAMIRGNHVDLAILGALQVDERGVIANWAVPGKNIIGVGGAMDLLEGAKRVFIAMNHVSKDGSFKILDKCTYPITSLRRVDMIVTELAVFKVGDTGLVLTEIMPYASLYEIKEKTSAHFIVELET